METKMIFNIKPVLVLVLSISISFIACKVEPEIIHFGEDQCYSCKMMIVDNRFGGELVSKKGRIIKFDAMECLIEHINKTGEEDHKFIMAIDYANPGTLIDARKATFYISQDIPSPMGANLSVYSSETPSISIIKSSKGDFYNWIEVKKVLKR
jgi:copper chaperone NosL